MKQLSFKIIGIKPVLFHKFNIEVVSNTKKIQSGSAGNNPDEWRTTFFEKNGQLYFPSNYWLSALTAGGAYTKVGRGTIKSKIPAVVSIDDDIILFNRFMPENWKELKTEEFSQDSSQPIYLDIRGVMNPNSKGRNVRYRVAMSSGWECTLNLTFDDTVISKEQMIKVVQDTGQMIGISNGRTLGYGRFSAELI